MATHSSILAWRIPWALEPGGIQSMGSQSQTQLSTHVHTLIQSHIFNGDPRGFTYFQITTKNSVSLFLQVETKLYHTILCCLLGNWCFSNRNKYSHSQEHGGHQASGVGLFRNLLMVDNIKAWLFQWPHYYYLFVWVSSFSFPFLSFPMLLGI